jgi:hypothetical protein
MVVEASIFLAASSRSCPEDVREGGHMPMRFLLIYLLLVAVFGFGFLCASAFTVGED